MLKRIIYLSTATDLLPAQALDAILASSRDNNGRDGITGLLLYDGGNFIQTIEGEPATLQSLMQRITADPRHYGLRTVEDVPVRARMFADWSMGYGRLDRPEMAQIVEQLAVPPAPDTTVASVMLNVFLRQMDGSV